MLQIAGDILLYGIHAEGTGACAYHILVRDSECDYVQKVAEVW